MESELKEALSEPYSARWNSLEKAQAFVLACEKDPSASPYDYGAVPPFITQTRIEGLYSCPNPDYEDARYELIFHINRPESSKIEKTKESQ